jgi:multiple sugar transport system permease protein
MLSPGVGLIMLFVLVPLALTAVLSFSNWTLFSPVSGISFAGLANYKAVLAPSVGLRSAYLHTFLYAAGSVVVILPVGFALALMLFSKDVLGRPFMRMVLFVPYMIPTVAMAVVWGYLYEPTYGPIDVVLQALGLPTSAWLGSIKAALFSLIIFNIWQTLGYYTIILLAARTGISETYYEAARVDGAGSVQLLAHITIPLMRKAFVFVLIVLAINTLQVFDVVYVLTNGGPVGTTETVAFDVYRLAFEYSQLGQATAGAMLLFAVLLALVVFLLWIWNRQEA